MPAPKGNKFAVGNSGREKRFTSNQELRELLENYFKECQDRKETRYTKEGIAYEVSKPVPFTIEGLCDVMECDRRTLLNYEKAEGYEDYFHTIKWAKNKVARNKAERGIGGEGNGHYIAFDMKNNHGYKDKTEVDNNMSVGSIKVIRPE